MAEVFSSADYYKDIVVSTKRIGDQFSDCLFEWHFPADKLEIKNDSILTNIQYSYDGVHVAGRLKHGTDTLLGGESYLYEKTTRMKLYLRRSHDANDDVEFAGEVDIPFRLWISRETGADGQ